jgi:hypothetical protein
MQISLTSIPNALEIRDSLPRPDWPVVSDWVEANIAGPALNDAWTQIARDWLEALIEALPAGYSCQESPEFMLLSNGDTRSCDRILQSCEASRQTVLEVLAGVARDEGYGKHVVFAFGDSATYFDYIADFYPDEGEFALSGGMFLDRGYGHFAMCMEYGGQRDRTIAHELNHAFLRHLPLPLWLNEGVTQVIEDMVVGASSFIVNREMLQRHRDYWNSDSIHLFWSGSSFFSPDDGQELSYHLSQILFRNLMSDFPQRITDYLNAAHFADAGNEAMMDVCRVSLSNRLAQFLGDGDWSPRTDYFEIGH